MISEAKKPKGKEPAGAPGGLYPGANQAQKNKPGTAKKADSTKKPGKK